MWPQGMDTTNAVSFFDSYRVPHPIQMESARLVVQRTLNSSYPILNVLGPAGVGKSKGLIPEIEFQLKEYAGRHDGNPGHIPVISVRAPAQNRRFFNWSKFFRRVLHAGGHLLADKVQTSNLEEAFVSLLKHRQPIALIVDEAQHFTNVTPASATQQLDYLKDLISDLKSKVILVGNYELRNYAFANEQIGRRNNSIVHFARYRIGRSVELVKDSTGKLVQKDVEAQQFFNIIHSFEQRLPISEPRCLTNEWSYFYDNTLGCVGILKDWLSESLQNLIAEEKSSLDIQYIKQFAPAARKLEVLWNAFASLEDEVDSLYKTREQLDEENKKPSTEETHSNAKRPTPARPGKRKPTRDPAGERQRESSNI